MLLCHWLSLWDGNFGSGSDGEVRDSSRLGREKEGAPGLWRVFLQEAELLPLCVTGFDMGSERSSRNC